MLNSNQKRTSVTPPYDKDRSEVLVMWVVGVFIIGILALIAGMYVYSLFF